MPNNPCDNEGFRLRVNPRYDDGNDLTVGPRLNPTDHWSDQPRYHHSDHYRDCHLDRPRDGLTDGAGDVCPFPRPVVAYCIISIIKHLEAAESRLHFVRLSDWKLAVQVHAGFRLPASDGDCARKDVVPGSVFGTSS